MPGSEYYDREPSQAEIEYEISKKRIERDALLAFKTKLILANTKRGISDSRLDTKLQDVHDYIDARLWRIKI